MFDFPWENWKTWEDHDTLRSIVDMREVQEEKQRSIRKKREHKHRHRTRGKRRKTELTNK
jgi:hypothetical protein